MAWPNPQVNPEQQQLSPMLALALKANVAQQQQAEQPQPQQPPQPAAAAPAQAPTGAPAAPAPAAAPSGGGGGGFSFGGIGTALNNMFSGAGLMGLPAGSDKVDPSTGVSQGEMTRARNMGLFKMGIMLMAAGSRQSDESRARILASLPEAMDTSGQINAFASNRLKMAQVKLIEQEAARSAAAQGMLRNTLAGFQPAAASPLPGVATAQPGAYTGQQPQAQAEAPAQAAPGSAVAAAPQGGPSQPPDMSPEGVAARRDGVMGSVRDMAKADREAGQLGPATGQAVAAAPAAPADQPADGAQPAQGFVPPAAPGQAQAAGGARQSLPVGPPPPPPIPKPTLSQADAAYVSSVKPEEALKFLSQKQQEALAQERMSDPYLDPKTGLTMQDVYRGGSKVRTVPLTQQPHPRVVIETGPDGRQYKRTYQGDTMTNEERYDDPKKTQADAQVQAAELGFLKEERTELAKVRTGLLGAERDFTKAHQMAADIRSGKTNIGTFNEMKTRAARYLSEAGILSPIGAEKLEKTGDVKSLIGGEGAKFAKENFGPAISNNDVNTAMEIVGGMMNSSKEEVARAIERVAELKEKNIGEFRTRIGEYNGKLPGNLDKKMWGVEDVPFTGKPMPNARYSPRGWVVPDQNSPSGWSLVE